MNSCDSHTFVLTIDGVKCRANNDYGQTDVSTDLLNARDLATGSFYTCALTDDDMEASARIRPFSRMLKESVNWLSGT